MKAFSPVLSIIIISSLGVLPSQAATKSWQGDPFSFHWSDPDNWDPSGVPQNGDDLSFDNGSFATQGMINDLTNLTVKTLAFNGGSWLLTGNELGIQSSIDNSSDGLAEIGCPLRLEGTIAITGFSGYDADSADVRVFGPINLNGHTLKVMAREDTTVDLAGAISGVGSVRVYVETANYFSSGTVKFSGTAANTFTGSVSLDPQSPTRFSSVQGANLVLNKQSGWAVPGALIVGDNCDVKLDHSDQIANNAAVTLGYGAKFLLQGHSENIGSLSMAGSPGNIWNVGRTTVETDGGTLSVEGNITAINSHPNPDYIPVIRGKLGLPPGDHNLNVSGSQFYGLDIQAQTLGGGGIVKTGAAGLMLSGNNTFSGDVTVSQGILTAASGTALGSVDGSTCLSNNATLLLQNAAIYGERLFVRGNRVFSAETAGSWIEAIGTNNIWSGPIILDTNLIVTGFNGGAVNFNGPISGSGGLRCLSGIVQLSGADANTFTGETWCEAMLLQLNKSPGVRAFGGRLTLNRDGGDPSEVRWLADYQCVGVDVSVFSGGLINVNNHREDFGPVTFAGGTIATGAAGELGLYGLLTVNASSTQAYISGRLGLPPGSHEFLVQDGAAFPDLWIDATVLGAGHLRKTGPGQMWMTASNTYAGLTTVAEGALSIFHPNGLGASTAGTTVNQGAILELSFDSGSLAEPLALRGTGSGNGALGIFGNVTLRTQFPSIYAAIDLTTNTTVGVAPNGRLTVDGFISGIGPLTKVGPGTLVLANANDNTYSGDTIVAEGVLNLSKPNSAISVPGNLIVGPPPLGSSAIARWSTPGGMNPGAIATINADSLLDLNGNNQSLSRLNLNDGGDAQTGAGMLSFQGGGVVNVGSLSALGSHNGSTFNGNIGLTPNGTLTFAVSPFAPSPPFYLGPELEVNSSIPAPIESIHFERAGLTKAGAGRMRLFGNNSFRGWVNVGEGTLTVGNGTALGALFFLSGTYLYNNGVLELEGGVNIDGERLFLDSTAAPAFVGMPGESHWNGPVILGRDSTIGAGPGSLLELSGIISGTGNLTKVGSGTLRFGGGDHNTYAGETFVNEGVLLLSKPTAITAVPGSLNIGTPAGLPATAANLTSYQVVGNIFINRNGLLNLNGQVENVDHLWLMEGGDVVTTTGVLAVKTGGSIQVVPGAVNDPATISGILEFLDGDHIINVAAVAGPSAGPELDITAVVTSSGAVVTLQKNGTGTLRLAANNDYLGTTMANAGVLRIDGSQPQSPVQIKPAGTLQGIGTVGLVDFTSGGGVVSPGASPGILNCSSFNNAGQPGGVLRMELNGPNPGPGGYDQLNVNGSVTLTGITLNLIKQFSPQTNSQFILINNDGADAVIGTFNGLPQNATLVLGADEFRISYTGGTGNDVVLTHIAFRPLPALTIQRIPPSSVRLLWPTNDPAFHLQYSTNLLSNDWTAASPAPVITGTNYVVTNATAGGIGSTPPAKFYRLIKP